MRDLDVRVAEALFGHRICRTPQPGIQVEVSGSWQIVPVPPYSTDIVAAFAVVAAMRARGWEYEIGSYESRPGHHYAIFRRPMDNPLYGEYEGVYQSDDVLATAICQAAVQAMEGT